MKISKKKKFILYAFLITICSTLSLSNLSFSQSKASKNAKVYFVSPKDGAVLINPVRIVFGLSGMKISPAGIEKKFSGHHHLLVDVKNLPNLTKPIPSDKNHIHFGKGQTEVELNLSAGRHSLQLLFADHIHVPHVKPVMSNKIFITVK